MPSADGGVVSRSQGLKIPGRPCVAVRHRKASASRWPQVAPPIHSCSSLLGRLMGEEVDSRRNIWSAVTVAFIESVLRAAHELTTSGHKWVVPLKLYTYEPWKLVSATLRRASVAPACCRVTRQRHPTSSRRHRPGPSARCSRLPSASGRLSLTREGLYPVLATHHLATHRHRAGGRSCRRSPGNREFGTAQPMHRKKPQR